MRFQRTLPYYGFTNNPKSTLKYLFDPNIYFTILTDVDIDIISTCESLENLNLEDNPLKRDCQENLTSITKKQIMTTQRELEEWEDLSI